jgi:hypothetical protein
MRGFATVLLPVVLLLGPGAARAQVEVLTPDMVARLDPAKEKPLKLSPAGDIARFVSSEDAWEEGAPPLILDLDKDGVQDFVVLSLLDAESLRQAIVIHDWGEAPDVFGRAVFYVILDAQGGVVEWAGRHRLTPRPARGVPAPSTPSGAPRP